MMWFLTSFILSSSIPFFVVNRCLCIFSDIISLEIELYCIGNPRLSSTSLRHLNFQQRPFGILKNSGVPSVHGMVLQTAWAPL